MIEPRDLNDLVHQSIENDNCSIVKVDEKFYFFDVDALTELLKTEEVIINSHWWKSENNSFGIKTNPAWPEQACRTFSFGVNCSDTFAYACADAEGFPSACSASMNATMPPARWALATACRATVVLPEDSGP